LFSNEKERQLVFFVLIFKKNFALSHIPQRKEKDCLNCGTEVQGRYCHVCGQENVVPKETFWHMVTHFFFDITHFDSQFFASVKDLLFRPGFLSKEYMIGRRASYLHPVRMYVFTSAIFFLLFFSVFKPHESISVNGSQPMDAKIRADYIISLQERLKKDTGNTDLLSKLALAKDTSKPLMGLDTLIPTLNTKERTEYIISLEERLKKDTGNTDLLSKLALARDSSRPLTVIDTVIPGGKSNFIRFGNKVYRNVAEYDSFESSLPSAQRDSWVTKRLIRKAIAINEKYRENPGEAFRKFLEGLLHRLPYMLFVSLPLFALILKLVYIRRKQFYFADHGVFTIHLYIFSFIILLLVFSFGKLGDLVHSNLVIIPVILLFLWLFIYLYKAMRNFYGQGRAKTFFKYLFVAFWSSVMMLVLFILFIFFSAFTL
jgi:hypothetical protein